MSLFPAYAQHQQDVDRHVPLNDVNVGVTQCGEESGAASLAREVQLLESDGDEPAPAARLPPPPPAAGQDYYLDTKLDRGNLRVSTLYYPGRPQYRRRGRAARGAAGAERARYWQRGALGGAGGARGERAEGDEAAARVAALRRALARSPADTHLWLHLLFLQETWGSEGEALAVAEEGAGAAPGPRLRAERHRLRCLHLPHDALLQRLRADIDREAEGSRARVEAWERLVRAAGERGGPEAAAAALRAALGSRAPAALYPRLLLEYGAALRAAGLWERLVLLLELVAAMNFPRAAFPPPPALDAELQDREDELVASGLPLSTVWVRAERARAAVHWRAAAGAAADPQRAPLPADVADLLLPVADPDALLLLAVNALRLAKVPLLGASAAGRAALGGAAQEGACGERLVALQWAARRLPAAHGARLAPAEARRALGLLLDPPHALSDGAGFLSWLEALWEAGCAALEGARRSALVCWRLRWLAALAALAEPAERARLRCRARGVLRRWAGGVGGAGGALCFAQWARLEHALGGSGQEPALHALRAATKDPAEPHHHLLYLARVVAEVSGEAAGRWAVGCAALRRPPPPAQLLDHAPPAQHMDDALQACEEQCALLERSLDLTEESESGEWAERDSGAEEGALWALLPDAGGEWAAARAVLTAAPGRGPLAAHSARLAARARSARARRYAEHAAAALVALDRRAAPLLAHLHPDNPLLALVSAGTPVWAQGAAAGQGLQRALRPPGDPLAALLPPLRRALLSDWQPEDAARVCAACARAAGGGPLVWALRLEAEARAPRPRTKHALYAALDRHPYHKWLAVRGAQWEGGEAASLADVLLERQCRLHALPEELLPSHGRAAPHTSPPASIVK